MTVTELMSPKKAKANDQANSIGKSPVTLSTKIEALKDRSNRRNGLGIYIDTPETNPDGRVIEYDDDFVVVKDAFPKARYVSPVPFNNGI